MTYASEAPFVTVGSDAILHYEMASIYVDLNSVAVEGQDTASRDD